MTDFDITLPAGFDPENVPAAVEGICVKEALHLTMKDTLRKYPGCTHWHFKKGKAPGVLEVTWWPSHGDASSSRLWLSAHGNRMANWITEAMPHLKTQIEMQLAKAS